MTDRLLAILSILASMAGGIATAILPIIFPEKLSSAIFYSAAILWTILFAIAVILLLTARRSGSPNSSAFIELDHCEDIKVNRNIGQAEKLVDAKNSKRVQITENRIDAKLGKAHVLMLSLAVFLFLTQIAIFAYFYLNSRSN